MKLSVKPSSMKSGIRFNWNRFKSKLLVTYTLSYILIFLVPLSCVTFIIYHNATTNLRSEIEQSNVNQLNQVRLSIDNQMNNLLETANTISFDEHLTKFMVSHPYYSREAIASLARYKTSNTMLEELFLYYRGDDKIYSSQGMTDLDLVFGDMFRFDRWQPEEIKQSLNETAVTTVRPAEYVTVHSRKESMLAMLFPIKTNDPYPYGTILYLMKEEQLTGVMDSILNDFSGSSYILSGTGDVLTANYRGDALRGNDLRSLIKLEPGIHNIELGGERYSVVTVKSRVNGWTYVTAIPSYQFFEQVGQIRTIILLVFFITVLVGIAAAMLLARRQYHPIRDLLEFASLQDGVKEKSKSRNEWDWIKQTIHDYHARIDMQEPFVRNQYLMLLFKHGKPDDPEIERMIVQSGLELPEQACCFTIILNLDEQSRDEQSWEDQQALRAWLNQLDLSELQARIYGVEFSVTHQLALMVTLLPSEEEDMASRVSLVVDELDEQLAQRLSRRPNLGVGTVYDDLSGLNQSFLEAASALEQRRLTFSSRVAYFDELAEPSAAVSSESYWIPKKSLLKLEQSLKQGNEATAIQLIADMMEMLKRENLSVGLLRCLCFDVLNSLLRTAAELGMDEVHGEISSLHAFETLEGLENRLSSLAVQICSEATHQTETAQPALMDEIVAYVAQNYADYTLSLEHIALKYDTSTSYLSRSFKEKTGLNFTQYIWQCRLKEVILQLNHTSAPLKEIIERVGYLDAPNFIRKFKKETGYTPGQYRKLHSISGSVPTEE
ncbi:YesN/AraC family two-component response regulator [Paenibacillus castaneae]|uniref:helix-turn-helix domain-containing protein n=1 Tax=Paenibacillus castaneae TaxID=474957 RepID=UPI000C9AC4B2|nr:helix-turn-helix domain-containing protein [Paenibacillus castaneae]NIK78053.1 YesN/AraC family two-component response regulator [Paenibacillus castaneae]